MKFAYIFIAAAVLMVLVHFTIAGFAPYFMVLMPAFPNKTGKDLYFESKTFLIRNCLPACCAFGCMQPGPCDRRTRQS
jgi:hypothetical protein